MTIIILLIFNKPNIYISFYVFGRKCKKYSYLILIDDIFTLSNFIIQAIYHQLFSLVLHCLHVQQRNQEFDYKFYWTVTYLPCLDGHQLNVILDQPLLKYLHLD